MYVGKLLPPTEQPEQQAGLDDLMDQIGHNMDQNDNNHKHQSSDPDGQHCTFQHYYCGTVIFTRRVEDSSSKRLA